MRGNTSKSSTLNSLSGISSNATDSQRGKHEAASKATLNSLSGISSNATGKGAGEVKPMEARDLSIPLVGFLRMQRILYWRHEHTSNKGTACLSIPFVGFLRMQP